MKNKIRKLFNLVINVMNNIKIKLVYTKIKTIIINKEKKDIIKDMEN